MAAVDPLAASMTEKALQTNVQQLAKLRGWLTYHTYDSRRSDPGFPDLVMARGRRLIFAELKSERGRVSPAQAEWLAELQIFAVYCGSGTVGVYVWRPSDWLSGEIEEELT